jgi:hypothetical protein
MYSIRADFQDYQVKGSQTNANPDPGQTLESQKTEFLHYKYTYLGTLQ